MAVPASSKKPGKGGGGKRTSRRHPSTHIKTQQNDANADDMVVDASEEEDVTQAGKFLLSINEKHLSRTRGETNRIHRQELAQQKADAKMKKRKAAQVQQEEEEEQESDAQSTDMEGASVGSDVDEGMGSDEETAYIAQLREKQRRQDRNDKAELRREARKKLPTRDEDGWSSGSASQDEQDQVALSDLDSASEEEDAMPEKKEKHLEPKSTITTGARFGLRAPYDIFSIKKKSDRVRLARDQIARLATDIINDPEMSLGLIKRLFVFTQSHVKDKAIDDVVRTSAMLSLCAVFIDILPGYRIRELSETEKNEQVNQELARRREYEQGLVKVYALYVKMCDRMSRKQSGAVYVKAMCTLAVKATHFNERTNLLRSIVSCLSRRTWDATSDACAQALTTVLQHDRQGDVSLEVVRLLNRMIKERSYRVDARVLDILIHLRLLNELTQGKRADTVTSAMSHDDAKNDVYNKKLKSKDIRKGLGEHLSKKQAKRRKDMREIEAEMKEAEAEVDQEVRERHQTETLKLLFVLYFSCLKNDAIDDALLAATMNGLILFQHRINVDFFRDLLAVLRGHIEKFVKPNPTLALHCIVTALELLNGQGEALSLDVSDIVAELYHVMLFTHSAKLLQRALQLALITTPAHAVPHERVASFMVRMSVCALHAPPDVALALVHMMHIMKRRFPALHALFVSEDRARNGFFDATQEQLDGLRPLQAGYVLWPLSVLSKSSHQDVCTRVEALLNEEM